MSHAADEAPKRGRPRKERYASLQGGFWKSKKVRRLSLEARGVLVMAWSYCASEMTDGAVPIEMLEMWGGPRWQRIRKELTARHPTSDGSRGEPFISFVDGEIDAHCHDFLDFNIARAEWESMLERDRSRPRKRGEFPTGNPTGNGSDIRRDSGEVPTGDSAGFPRSPADFPAGRSDEDEDEDESHLDRSGGGEPGRAGAPGEPARTTPRIIEPPGAAGIAELAYDAAIRAKGGAYAVRDGDASAFRTVVDSAAPFRGVRTLRAVLDEWATDYVAAKDRHRPAWWAEYAQERASNGGQPVRRAKSRRGFDPPAPSSAFVDTEITRDLFRKGPDR